MSEIGRLLEHYDKGVRFPRASGFEVSELLDVRSQIAASERELDLAQRPQLEEADSVFLRNAPSFYESVATLGDLRDLRHRAAASCSDWWWYLEKLVLREPMRT